MIKFLGTVPYRVMPLQVAQAARGMVRLLARVRVRGACGQGSKVCSRPHLMLIEGLARDCGYRFLPPHRVCERA